MKTSWKLEIRAQADTLSLDVYDVIGDPFGDAPTAKQVLDQLSAAKSAKTIDVHLNSAGGIVDEGIAMYSLLAAHPAKKMVYVDGIAASIASVVAMSGDEIIMAESAMMMIHNPWSLALGDAAEMRKTADVLDQRAGQLAGIYSARTGQPMASVRAAMDAETWMTAQEARALNYATKVVPSKKMAASALDLTPFRRTPAAALALAAAAAQPNPQPKGMTMQPLASYTPDQIAEARNSGAIDEATYRAMRDQWEADGKKPFATKATLPTPLPSDAVLFNGKPYEAFSADEIGRLRESGVLDSNAYAALRDDWRRRGAKPVRV